MAAGAAGLALATAGEAHAEAAHIFRLRSEPVERALLRFAIQGDVSVGGFPVAGCAGESRAVVGFLRPSEALRRLLPAGCAFQRVDEGAFRIVASPATPRAPERTSPPAPQQELTSLSELVVTAERRREPLRGSPFAVSVASTEEIERLGAGSFSQLASRVAAVTETNLGPGRDKIYVRGLSDGTFTGQTQSTVGLYLDDVPITYNAPDPDLRLADIERVEILRGPQGSLYGSGSIGGIVRLVTMKPDPNALTGRVVLEGALNERSDRTSGAEAMVNLPFLQGRAAVRAVAYREDLAGYLDNTRLGLDDVNRGRRSGLRLSGLANLGNGWQVQASLAKQALSTDDSQYVQGPRRRNRTAAIQEPHDNDFSQIGMTLAHSGPGAEVRISTAYIDHDLSTRYDAMGAFDLPAGKLAAVDESQRVGLWVAEATAASTSEDRFRWLVGAFGSSAHQKGRAVLDASLGGGSVRSMYRRRDRLVEAAVFGEASYDLTPQLTATLGGRLFVTRVETNARDFELAAAPVPEVHGRLTDHGFAPKLRLSYAFAPELVVYAQMQDGFRAGGFNVPAQADGVAGGPDVAGFAPDRLRNYELGGEGEFFHRTVTLRAAIFRAEWSNVQTDQFRASGLPLTLNIGDGSNLGLEGELVWNPDRHWQVRLAGLLDHPELTRSSNLFPARVDVGLPGVARGSGSIGLLYRFALAGNLKVELSGEAAYVGPSYLTFDGAQATRMGDYGEGRIAAAVSGRNWRAQAYVNNVTDASGDTFAFGNPFVRGRARQATPLPPRTYGLVLSRSF